MIVPSSVFSATLPVKPSQTITSAAPSSSVAALGVALEAELARREQRVRLERQLVPLLRLLADREQAHVGPLDVEDLLGEDRAHVRELEQVLGPRVGVRAGVDAGRTGRCSVGIATAIAGPDDARAARRMWSRPAASMAPVFPAETTASASPSPTARHGPRRATSRASPRTASAGFSSIAIASRRDDVLEPVRVEARRAEEDRLDARRRGVERAGDDLVGRAVAPEGVHGDPDRSCALRSGRAERLDLAAPYVLHVGQTWCGRFGEPHCRAHVDARRLDAVLRAALVAAGLRGLSSSGLP